MTTAPRKPFWLYPNLLSLDAPLVAITWLYIFGETWRLGYHPVEIYIALGLVVWSIYVFDRLLDSSLLEGQPERLEARHRFHRRHRKLLGVGMGLALISALTLVMTRIPMGIFNYMTMGTILVAGYVGLSLLSSRDHKEVALTKNLMAGLTFAFGTALCAHLFRLDQDVEDMLLSPEFISFAMLCILNISAIDLWEHSKRSEDEEVKVADELTLMLPLALLGIAELIFAIRCTSTSPFHYAILTGVALLFLLNHRRSAFSMDALRVLADLTLIAPLLVFKATMET